MKPSSLEFALEAMFYMERGRPYSLHPEERKRKLLDKLRPLCREIGISPLIIGGMAVAHHGYVRFTHDVDFLVTEAAASALIRRLKSALGWSRRGHGFKNKVLDVSVDVFVEGSRAAPCWKELLPSPGSLRAVKVKPFPVAALPDLIALKVKSGRMQDDADVVELLKRHVRRIASIASQAGRHLSTPEAREHLKILVRKAREELRR
jgi:hypothetical protein